MAQYRPPVIPEITKAFENDPRTKLARNAMAMGSSTAPVAQGGYAWADGIARALQGVLGAVIEKRTGKKYGADEAELLALRKARMAEQLTGLPVGSMPDKSAPAAAPAPAATAAIADALGAPPPPPQEAGTPAVGPAGLPMAPPPGGPAAAPTRPAGAPGAAMPPMAPAGAPGAAPGLPPIPPPLAMPERPTAVGPVQSPRLAMAQRIIQDGNRYESAYGADMLDKGLGEQGTALENAAGRQATLDNTGYAGALNMYGQDRTARTEAGFKALEREDEQEFTLTRDEKGQAFEMRKLGFDRQTAYGLAKMNNDAAYQRALLDAMSRQTTAAEKSATRRNMFFSTPTGAKIFDATTQRMTEMDALDNQLSQFTELMKNTGTGGLILGNIPEAATWASSGLQSMERLTQDMSIKMSAALKGAVSDKEGVRIVAALPSVRKKPGANDEAVQQTKIALARAKQFETYKLEAMAAGTHIPFLKEWRAYVDSTPFAQRVKTKDGRTQMVPGMSFEQWQSSRPKFDQNGQRIN